MFGIRRFRISALCAALILFSGSNAFAEKNAPAAVSDVKEAPEDVWSMSFSRMDEHDVSVVFNESISSRVDSLPLPNAMVIQIKLKSVSEAGFPTDSEFPLITQFEEVATDLIHLNGGVSLGRVTTNGIRLLFALVPEGTSAIEGGLKDAAETLSYEVDVRIRPDPSKDVYWQALYPTPDERQVMGDMEVLRALNEGGDDSSAKRQVDHWAFFKTKTSAEQFAEWCEQSKYRNVVVEKSKQGLSGPVEWAVHFSHDGTMMLNDITGHTISIDRKVREVGGEYDGWETQVILPADGAQ